MRREDTYVEGRGMNRLPPSAVPQEPAFWGSLLR